MKVDLIRSEDAEIPYGPDVTPEQYEAALKQSWAELGESFRKDFGPRPKPTPASMPKKKRRTK